LHALVSSHALTLLSVILPCEQSKQPQYESPINIVSLDELGQKVITSFADLL